MKNIKFLILAIAAYAMSACCNSEPKKFEGTIIDATMNTVVVKELTGEKSATFSTEEADMAEANGLLIGNLATIEYKGDLQEVTPAMKVSTDPTYAKAVGEWVMVDPINADSVMGISLMIEGQAASINMATLRYTGWELQGEADKIFLKGVSEGTGEAQEFSQTAALGTNAEQQPTLSIEGTEIVLTKRAM